MGPQRPEGKQFYNSNSVVTQAQFEQEAKLWSDAFKSANAPKATFGGTLGVVGLVLQLVINLVWLLFYGIASACVWLFGSKSGGKVNMRTPLPTSVVNDMPDVDVLENMANNAERVTYNGQR